MSGLRIYFSSQWHDSETACPWALCNDEGTVIQSGCDTLAAMPQAKECIAIIAADRTLCQQIETPPGTRRRWLGALPLLAEEHTLSDPGDNHVAPLLSPDRKHVTLYVADKSWLRGIVTACRAAGLQLRQAVPEIALPAVEAGNWTLAWNGQDGFICTAPMSGMELDTGDGATAPFTLRRLLETALPAPQKILLRFFHDMPADQKVLPQWHDMPEMVPGENWDWRNAPVPANVPNLLYGEFAPPLRPLEWWPRLRPAAMLLFILLAIEMLGTNLQWAILAYEKSALRHEMVRTFHQAFGSAATVVNAPLQMQRKLADLRHSAGLADDGDLLPLLNSAAQALSELPAGSLHEAHFESGRLDLDIRLNNFAEATKLQHRLQDLGLGVHANIDDTGNGVEARISLQAGAAT